MNRPTDALGAWPVRVVWVVLPLVTGPVFDAALGDASRAVQMVVSGGLWSVWAAVLVATLVPRTVTLTLLRIVAPAAPIAVVWAVAAAGGDVAVGWRMAALVGALAAVGLAFSPTTGHVFVNGSSYGDEVRFPLRVPGPILLGPLEAVWLAVALAGVAGPLLLAVKMWIPGVVLLTAGVVVALWGVRVLHGLSRRWLVLVPAGLVLHDPLVLGDSVLLRRAHIAAIGPAPATTEAVDLTRGALGLAVEVRLTQPVLLTIGPAHRGGALEPTEVTNLLVTPTRPGALLAATTARRLATTR